MDDYLNWANSAGKPIRSHQNSIYPAWNGPAIPSGRNYRNFAPIELDLLDQVAWARIVIKSFVSGPRSEIYDENGVRERADLYEWAERCGKIESPEHADSRTVAQQFHEATDTAPPQPIKETAQIHPEIGYQVNLGIGCAPRAAEKLRDRVSMTSRQRCCYPNCFNIHIFLTVCELGEYRSDHSTPADRRDGAGKAGGGCKM